MTDSTSRDLRLVVALLGLTILWTALAFWYHRLWLEALTDRTDDLQHATLFLATRVKAGAAEAGRSDGTEAAFNEETVEISWPAAKPQDDHGGNEDAGA